MTLLERLTARIQPLETEMGRAWWDAAVSGSPDAYARLEELRNRMDELFREPGLAARLAAARSAAADPIEARALRLLELETLPRQVDPALGERQNALATDIERIFSTHRPRFRGEERTVNDLEKILDREVDDAALAEAWEGLMAVGPRVAEPLLELVGLRNETARQVGYSDYHALKLELYEQVPATIEEFFDRLDQRTAEPFADIKTEIDARLAERLGRAASELMPWHYGNAFFQETPDVFGAELDSVYAGTDLVDMARAYFARIGLPVDGVLERSSLYEAPGKGPHAFAIDLDREGDVRILLNLRDTARWMGTTLHELGHAVYDLGVASGLPWMLRHPSHTLTTEAIAMLFGRLARDAGWMRSAGLVDADRAERLREPTERELRAQMLVFSRWAQVMTRFERELYRDPGQDLNALWWSLKSRHQGLDAPPRPAGAADWAAKIHVVVAPVYYHNYMLGECFASQIHAAMRATIPADGDPLVPGSPAAGDWLLRRIFAPGATLHYDDLAREATGAPVQPDAFAEQFLAPAPA